MPLLLLPLVFCGPHSFHFHALEYVFPAQTFLARVPEMLLSCSWAHASVTAAETPLMVGVADDGKMRRLKHEKKQQTSMTLPEMSHYVCWCRKLLRSRTIRING